MPDKLDDAFFRAVFHSPLAGIGVVDLQTATIIDINEVLLHILGCERDEIIGVPHAWLRFTPPEYHHLDQRGLQQILEQGYSDTFEKEYVRHDGSRVPVRVSSATVPGYPDRLIVYVSDLSQEQAFKDREENIQRRLELAISAANQGIWDLDLVTGEIIYSPRAKAIYGLGEDDPVTFEAIRDATHPDDLPFTLAQFQRATDPQIRDRSSYEYRIVRPDGTVAWAAAFGEAVFDGVAGAEKPVRYVGTIQDITAQKSAERKQAVLVAELNHRVKNMLAIVQSLAYQTMRGSDVPEEVAERLSGRLQALASAHNLLTEDGWDGATLRDIAAAALEPIVPDLDERFRLDGADVRLSPQFAVSLSMAFYELATNALKYGGLSIPTGRVELSWEWRSSPERTLFIDWRERGGPAIADPERQGFGTRMIKRMVGSDARGRVGLQFKPEGLECTIEVPAANVERTSGSGDAAAFGFELAGSGLRPQGVESGH